jgi:hypothetical protein
VEAFLDHSTQFFSLIGASRISASTPPLARAQSRWQNIMPQLQASF